MLLHKHHAKISFYQKDSPRGKILRALTLNDIMVWGGEQFVNVILVLYTIQFIAGGSATHFGLALFMYKGIEALSSISVGRFFDVRRGLLDELWGLSITSVLMGTMYMLLSMSTHLWQLYAAMVFLGFLAAINAMSWRSLFYNNIAKYEYAQTVGVYHALVSVSIGAAVALGGLMGDTFGFDVVVFYGGAIIALGGLVPLTIRFFLAKK